jgi:hypothetical protein
MKTPELQPRRDGRVRSSELVGLPWINVLKISASESVHISGNSAKIWIQWNKGEKRYDFEMAGEAAGQLCNCILAQMRKGLPKKYPYVKQPNDQAHT